MAREKGFCLCRAFRPGGHVTHKPENSAGGGGSCFRIAANKGGERTFMCVAHKRVFLKIPVRGVSWRFVQICWATEGAGVSHHQMKHHHHHDHDRTPLFLNPPLAPAGASQPPSTSTPHSQTRTLPFISPSADSQRR